jgi:CDP-diacylglycerol--glycerol-3-phosphate 3-phosphatidyltransferase
MPLLAMLIQSGQGWFAFWILVLAGITDLLDGYLARYLKQESDVGKLMDPVADKVFLCVAVIFLVARTDYPSILNPDPSLSPWIAVLLLSREFLVTGLRSMASSVGVVIAASQIGKIKTTFQFIGLGAIIAGGRLWPNVIPTLELGIPLYALGEIFLWLSIIMSYWSMTSYAYRVYLEFKFKGRT